MDDILNSKCSDGQAFVDRGICQSMVHPLVSEVVKNHMLISEELNDRAGNLNEEKLQKQNKDLQKIYCTQYEQLNHNILLPDGIVLLCSIDFGMQHVLGNLLKESYGGIMVGSEMMYIKQKMLDENDEQILCEKCTEAIGI